ncbi:YidC family membrane integrase SpoIIIJ [Geobacillus stearothermophilus]|uniref:YidC family membrane integrase SpoIIIJ n=1 Tax=Geobacillus stearothermophilus TaxID=1422 RepID=UPI000649E810|nr:YidC family membrane integrase SpoIIIJ [Geobacillus stearothermophilus]AKM20705.1 Membrane protein insertase MisCA precursor [Geobacillus sp. 12AMOR1]MDF9297188.1 YidC family membrane integrase SpoIIIJ [Geobacillus stearothermophilus]WJQ14085.1 YidC family membrane integrase SpoIIIJ [Geobacillus stearothermophilus]STO35901.1 Stage III sporulation protein J [[Flavobacterium] thermophilum]
MKRRILFIALIGALAAMLSGCTEINEPITRESKGFWNEYIVYPLSWLIKYVAGLLGGSFGLSIIVVTILIRLLILPLMIQQTRNAKAMQALQPEIEALRKKYSSKDAQTQQKLQQEMMLLFQKHGVNPMAGCLPILIQMPILIGFYHAIMRTREIAQHNFLWFDLGEKDPYFILPVIAGVTTFIQQKIMMAGSAQQNPQMAMLLWMMPIMIVIFAINFPAALSLYWVVGNIFSIVQTYLIKGPNVSAHLGGAKK